MGSCLDTGFSLVFLHIELLLANDGMNLFSDWLM